MERCRVYKSHPRPSRFSRDNGKLLRCQAEAVHRTRGTEKKAQTRCNCNIDDRYGKQLLDKIARRVAVVTCGMGTRADFRASNYRAEFSGTSYQLDAHGKS